MTRACVLFTFFLLFAALPVHAHVKSQSYSQWYLKGHSSGPAHEQALNQQQDHTISFNFIVDLRRVTQLARLYDNQTEFIPLFERHLRETLSVKQNTHCQLSALTVTEHIRGKLKASGQFNCPETISDHETLITIDSFHAVSSTHVHYARVIISGVSHDIVLNKAHRKFVYQSAAVTDSFSGFFAVGFWHVLVGLDHMLFLLALMLAAARPSTAIWCITGFTFGHSVTLGLATFGLIAPDMALIEAMIGLTIAVAANQAAQQSQTSNKLLAPLALAMLVLSVFIIAAFITKPYLMAGLGLTLFVLAESRLDPVWRKRFLPIMTVCFGLVHGAGFAEGLLNLNFDQNDLLTPMLGFNLGVEIAQLLGLCGFYLLILTAQIFGQKLIQTSQVEYYELSKRGVSLSLFALGMFWFAQRLWS